MISINLVGSILGETLVDRSTTYCTAMWNGLRCSGTHVFYGRYEHHVAMTSDENGDPIGHSWTHGYGGIDIREMPEPVYFSGPECDLDWSPALMEGFMPIIRTWGHLADLPTDYDQARLDNQAWIADTFDLPVELVAA